MGEAWVGRLRTCVGNRLQDMQTLSSGAWAYMRELTQMSGVSGADWEAYCSRLAVVESVYQDRCNKRPELPWDDDWYRRCEYSVDWATGNWEVTVGKDASVQEHIA